MFNYIRKALIKFLGGYDAAERTVENRKHWSKVPKDVNPSETNTPVVRQRLRLAARYEQMNNSYCRGMISTLARDTIGITGPNLQMMTVDKDINSLIESKWRKWSESENIMLLQKLNVMDSLRRTDGESFLIFSDNPDHDDIGIETLNVNVLPSRRVCNLRYQYPHQEGNVIYDDGVNYNVKTGMPISYDVSNSSISFGRIPETVSVNPRYMKHWYMPTDAEQTRGICEIAAALPLFAFLRRYTLAVIGAAEFAASMVGVLETQSLPNSVDGPAKVADFTEIEFVRNTLLSLPEGWKANAFKGEQPTNSYDAFVSCILREIGRAVDVPYGVVAGDSSKYNYSSARLDYRGYDDRISLDRKCMTIKQVNPVYLEWLKEFIVVRKDVRRVIEREDTYHNWRYAGRASIDPLKEARADEVRLKTLTTNLAEIYGDRGKDWEEQLEQRKKESDKLDALGIIQPKEIADPSQALVDTEIEE